MKLQLLGALAAVTLAVSACSQSQAPAEVQGGLEALFGTRYEESVTSLAVAANGVYAAVDAPNQPLMKFTRSGQKAFSKPSSNGYIGGVESDVDGNIYVKQIRSHYVDDFTELYTTSIRKYNPRGTVVWTRTLAEKTEKSTGPFATDKRGNVYTATLAGKILKGEFRQRVFLAVSSYRRVYQRARQQ